MPPKFTRQCIEFLRTRSWRGNVRELQNAIEHLAVLADPGRDVAPSDVPLNSLHAGRTFPESSS